MRFYPLNLQGRNPHKTLKNRLNKPFLTYLSGFLIKRITGIEPNHKHTKCRVVEPSSIKSVSTLCQLSRVMVTLPYCAPRLMVRIKPLTDAFVDVELFSAKMWDASLCADMIHTASLVEDEEFLLQNVTK